MQYRPLGRTGVRVSPLCLGTMMFGAACNQDRDDCVRVIHRALDAGINFVDTADIYSHGESEEIVGPRTMEHLESQLGAADTVLTADVLDRVDQIVPPGTNLDPADVGWDNPALTPAARRR